MCSSDIDTYYNGNQKAVTLTWVDEWWAGTGVSHDLPVRSIT